MSKPKLIQIFEHMTKNGGKIPKEFEPLIPFLERRAIIWGVAKNNGTITAKLAPSHEHYYKQYIRRKTGWFRWLFGLLYAMTEPDSRMALKTDARLVEEEAGTTLPATDALDWQP